MENETIIETNVPKKKILTREKKRVIFYSIMLILPLLHTLIFYFYLNFSSILLAFQKYELVFTPTLHYEITYTFDNFVSVLTYITAPNHVSMITTSVIYFAIHLVVGTSLALLFSYYIYKKYFLAELFRVILFLPQIVSSLVLVLLFKTIADDVYTVLFNLKANEGLMTNPNTRLLTLVLYNLWIGFGTNILLYCGAMSGIDQSIVESSHLDGVNVFTEFFYITFPMIFSTFTVFVVTALSTIFSQQLNLYAFFGSGAPDALRTIGYFMTISTLQSSLVGHAGGSITWWTYSEISAMGLSITLVTFPITFAVRRLMEKYGPSAN